MPRGAGTDDPWKLGENGTDRGLYGGVFAGVLGAIVLATSEPTVPAFVSCSSCTIIAGIWVAFFQRWRQE